MTKPHTPEHVAKVIARAVDEAFAAGWDCKYKHQSIPGTWADRKRAEIIERAHNRLATRS